MLCALCEGEKKREKRKIREVEYALNDAAVQEEAHNFNTGIHEG